MFGMIELWHTPFWILSLYWFCWSTRLLIKSLGLPKMQLLGERTINWRNFFLLCFSESFSMPCAMVILWHNNTLSGVSAVVIANVENLIGYLKYVYQMFFDAEYVTLSFHVYNATWLYTAYTMNDPFYFLLFRYPFTLLIMVERYINMRGRKVLFSELGLVLHTVDHLLHGMISARLLLYHFFGGISVACADVITVPFIILLSDSIVKLQDPAGEVQKAFHRNGDAAKSKTPVPRKNS